MTYTVTSAEASKMLKKLTEQVNNARYTEQKSCTFNAAVGEDIDSVRPEYSYEETRNTIDALNEKIRIIKHAVNKFNATHVVGDTGMTIDQVLVYLPQLAEKKSVLSSMQSHLPKERSEIRGIAKTSIIDYEYANYSIDEVKEDYEKVADEIRTVQTALDIVNNTKKMTFELPE